MNSQTKELSYSSLNEELLQQPLFKAKSWQLSSQTFKLEKRQEQHLALIGVAIHSLLSSLRQLYLQARSSYSDEYNWVRDYLERGKPEWICQLSQDTRFTPQMLSVMRPDIILTNTGYALTEIDSLPGGIGLTELLYQTYTKDTSNTSPFTLLEEFHAALARLRPDKENPVVIIIYNDEGETYWPEFDWIAAQLRSNGKKVYTSHVKDITCDTNTVSFNHNGEQMTADVIYRFFELFDDSSKNLIQGIAAVMNHSNLAITPTFCHELEEKSSMALFHHPRLAEFWKSKLSRRSWLTLRHIIPDSWIVDPVIDDLPPSATLWAPLINGKGVRNWTEIADASQKNRRLILKCSGFNELAWGARSVVVGHDVSKETWHRALSHALDNSDKEVHIIQTYKNPKIYEHPVYDEPHVTTNKAWRIRLCPFYFLNEKGAPDLAGALATLCPKDKKVIHGMRDACMLPATLNHAPVL